MINNVVITGLEESIIASGYPMSTDTRTLSTSRDYERAKKLGIVKSGSGHDCFLKGIVVQFDWKKSLLIERHVLRYNFIDIISSQSIMHKVLKLNVLDQCNEYVLPETIEIIEGLINHYNLISVKNLYYNYKEVKDAWYKIVYNLPCGYQLTARFTTNYLQLKTMYNQRRNHKLKEWQNFCDWCLTLPKFKELTGVDSLE